MNDPVTKTPGSVPASHGITWLVQSFSLLRRQAARLLLIAMLMQMILGLTQVPLFGLLVFIALPGLNAGILEAFHECAGGGRVSPALLFKPLSSSAHSGRLLAMGVLVLFVFGLSVSLVLSGNDQQLNDIMSRIGQGDMEAIAQLDQELLGKLFLANLIGISAIGTLIYFTIPLIWFHDRKLLPALGTALNALVKNWKAFMVLALGLFAVVIPASIVTAVLLILAQSGGLLSVIVLALMMILLVAFQLLLFGTQYCAFRDIFGIADHKDPTRSTDDSQLVA